MIPGLTTKLSEEIISLTATIYPKRDVIHVTSTASATTVATIVPTFGGGFSGILIMVNRSGGNIESTTTGNIAVVTTVAQNMAVIFVFSKATGKWYPGAIS